MTNRKWVTLHILWKVVSSHLFLWPTGSEWQCTSCERQSHHTFSYDQQHVSDIAHFMKGSLITWPTASEWHCTFCERQSHHTFSYDQQVVSDIAHFYERQLIHHIFSYDQQRVSDIAHFVKGNLVTSFSYDQQRVSNIAHFVKGVITHLFLWPTASEWCCTFCESQSHHIFSYDQQQVSGIVNFVKDSHITSFPMTNRQWVTLHIMWTTVSSHLYLWPTACEWHCTFCER